MIFGDPNKSGGFQNMLQRFAVYNFSNNLNHYFDKQASPSMRPSQKITLPNQQRLLIKVASVIKSVNF